MHETPEIIFRPFSLASAATSLTVSQLIRFNSITLLLAANYKEEVVNQKNL